MAGLCLIVHMLNTPNSPTREEIRSQLEKIVCSQAFRGAELLKSFLRYVIDRTLDGSESDVKEYTIATEVFGRKESYDPRIDSVVRVQAARLRSKLREFYLNEGRSELVHVNLPKGHYIPFFSYSGSNSRLGQVSATGGRVLMSVGDEAHRAIKRSWERLASSFLSAALAIITVLLGTSAYLYRSEATQLRQPTSPRPQDPIFAKAMAPFWADFLGSGNSILVAYSNPIFVGNPVDGMKYWLPLGSSALSLLPPSMRETGRTQKLTDVYTGVGEVELNYWEACCGIRV